MRKIYMGIVSLIVLSVPSVVWAGPVEWAEKKAIGLGAKIVYKFLGFLESVLIPHPKYLVISIIATGLTLAWMLGIEKVRRSVGRLPCR